MNPVDRLISFFETLRPSDLQRLDELYAPDARFKDPFNEIEGVPAIRAVFEHMFETLDEPRFVITECIAKDGQAFLTWDFHFRLRGKARSITVRGATHLRFDATGRVQLHRDYWDAAEELYEKLPLLGTLMRWLKRQARGG